jgi:predicted nucleic acid-binding protein
VKAAAFDMNVVVSGFLSPNGPPGRVVEWLRNGSVRAVLDDRIAAEYAEVLARPAFRLPPEEVRIVLAGIRSKAHWVEVRAQDAAGHFRDPDDAPFLECERAGSVAIVTGNLRHFPKSLARGVPVLTPAQFVAERGRAARRG